MQCFTAIEVSNLENDDGHPFTKLPSMLLHSLERGHAFKYNRAYAPSMHEGYALFIEEEQYVTEFKIIIACFIFTAIRALYNRNLELDYVPFVLSTVIWGMAFSAGNYLVLSGFRLESTLVITVARILISWYFFQYGDKMILILNMLHPLFLWLLAKYSISIDWKEVRSLIW